MARLIRNFDWTSTPVGPPKGWPASLRSAVRLMLNTQHPMFIWWGEDLVQFYNDAYRATMGSEMHPAALGARGRECWADIWPIIGPQIDMVMAGLGSTWNVDQLVPIVRHRKREDVWWTYGYSPIDLDDRVGGVLVVCTDVTERHLYAEALKTVLGVLRSSLNRPPALSPCWLGRITGLNWPMLPTGEWLEEETSSGTKYATFFQRSWDRGFSSSLIRSTAQAWPTLVAVLPSSSVPILPSRFRRDT